MSNIDKLLPKFAEITDKFVKNSIRCDLPSIFTIIETENIKSLTPNEKVNISIVNFSKKPLKVSWINYEGDERKDRTSKIDKKTGSKVNIQTYSNHVFHLYFDGNDPNSESIYFRVPIDKQIFYVGNLDDLLPEYTANLNESSWINNPCINLTHLEEIDKLVSYKSDSLNKLETILTRSTYYDETEETQSLIKSFFDSFNKNNKFIDAFFNPLNRLDTECFIKRISDYDVDCERKIVPSVYLGTEFEFTLVNDSGMDFTVYWIEYSGKPTKWTTVKKGSTQKLASYLGNVWAICNGQITHVFHLGQNLFAKNRCSVKISQLGEPLKIDIENYQAKTVDSMIIDENDLEKYNAKQGQIGDCWLLSTLISIYAAYPEKITSIFINSDLIESTGIVALRLWSEENKCWRLIILDDFLPCISNTEWLCCGPSGPLKNRFWVSLIEKAVAKQNGSFTNLDADLCSIKTDGLFRMILGPMMTDSQVIKVPTTDTDHKIFNELVNNYMQKNVCVLASRASKNNELIDKSTQMVSYHGYGLLDIKENVCDSGLSFVKCQNPWSNGGEWGGDWGDKSNLWNQFPDIKKELNFENKDDGAFWIEKKDFSKAFSYIWIAKCVNN
ncbi:unnamed protein product [Brachionus calyciflorus]|uniref:Calpain catalytic domain-containing protein n=1 Tax=Brachionus calyciflorus TaxID=104777 RepID=A0A813XC69_9BILA|nr:unnamed protein product [Brachionus calyciflorus]